MAGPRTKKPLVRRDRPQHAPIPGAVVATVVAAEKGAVLVDWDGNADGPRPARATVPLRNLSDPVLVVLAAGEPIIVGQIYAEVPLAVDEESGDVTLKGRRIRIEAEAEVVLAAGQSQIRLDALGKVVTTADQVVSRARGANKVQGGCVQLN